jgi:ribonuclease Z
VVEHARSSDLLVHEAFGLGNAAKRAHAFGHSTALEAGEAARAARVRRLILMHYRAGRLVDPAKLEAEAALVFGGPVEAARDLDIFDF